MAIPNSVPPLVASGLWLVLCFLLPELMPLNIRDIPYQLLTIDDAQVVVLNLELNNPYKPDSEETVPAIALIFISVILPILVFLAAHFLDPAVPRNNTASNRDDIETVMLDVGDGKLPSSSSDPGPVRRGAWDDTFRILTAFFVGLGATTFFTDFIKLYVGRLRPNFYNFCGFDESTLECTADDSDQHESRMSFPSGHSSLSMNGMAFVALFVMYKLKQGKFSNSPQFGMGLIPVSVALWVAASRLVDHWHHPSDVIAGSLIGGISALTTFNMFYLGEAI